MAGAQQDKKMLEYKTNFKIQFIHFRSIIIYFLLSFIFPFFMVSKFGAQDLDQFILMAFFIVFIVFIPLLIIHFNYIKYSKNVKIKFDEKLLSFYFNDLKRNVVFNVNDIQLFEQFKTFPFAEKRKRWFPWDLYNYTIIHLKNGESITINSYTIINLNLPIDKSVLRINKVFYPIIKEKD